MEAVGVAASILTLLEVVKMAVELGNRLEEAPHKVEKCIRRVRMLGMQVRMMLELQDSVRKDDSVPQYYPLMLKGLCDEMATLEPIFASIIQVRSTRRVRWALLGHSKARELEAELAYMETTLASVLTMLQHHRMQLLLSITTGLERKLAVVTKSVQHSSLCPECYSKKQQQTKMGSKNSTRRQLASFTRKRYCCSESASMTALVARLHHETHPTTLLSLKLDLWAKLSIQMEFSGWIPELRVDRITFRMHYRVPGDEPFLRACHDGDADRVRELLVKSPASLTYTDDCDRTPLCIAIERGHIQICRILLEQGASTELSFGREHTSALSWALRFRRMDIARLLINYKAPFDHINAWGWSPLFYLWWSERSREEDSSAFINLLKSQDQHDFAWLYQGIIDDEGWTLLARCAVFGRPEDWALLVRYGVDPLDRAPDSGWTALHFAISHGVLHTFEQLLPEYRKRSDLELPDFAGWTLLHLAVENGNRDIIRLLLENGADWEAKTLPSCDETIPKALQGIPASTCQIAAACGDQRYLDLIDLLDELGLLEDSGEKEDAWSDALEIQS